MASKFSLLALVLLTILVIGHFSSEVEARRRRRCNSLRCRQFRTALSVLRIFRRRSLRGLTLTTGECLDRPATTAPSRKGRDLSVLEELGAEDISNDDDDAIDEDDDRDDDDEAIDEDDDRDDDDDKDEAQVSDTNDRRWRRRGRFSRLASFRRRISRLPRSRRRLFWRRLLAAARRRIARRRRLARAYRLCQQTITIASSSSRPNPILEILSRKLRTPLSLPATIERNCITCPAAREFLATPAPTASSTTPTTPAPTEPATTTAAPATVLVTEPVVTETNTEISAGRRSNSEANEDSSEIANLLKQLDTTDDSNADSEEDRYQELNSLFERDQDEDESAEEFNADSESDASEDSTEYAKDDVLSMLRNNDAQEDRERADRERDSVSELEQLLAAHSHQRASSEDYDEDSNEDADYDFDADE